MGSADEAEVPCESGKAWPLARTPKSVLLPWQSLSADTSAAGTPVAASAPFFLGTQLLTSRSTMDQSKTRSIPVMYRTILSNVVKRG